MTYNGHILGIKYTSCCMRDEKMALGFHNLGFGGQWCGERGLIPLLLQNPRLISDRPCSQNPSLSSHHTAFLLSQYSSPMWFQLPSDSPWSNPFYMPPSILLKCCCHHIAFLPQIFIGFPRFTEWSPKAFTWGKETSAMPTKAASGYRKKC